MTSMDKNFTGHVLDYVLNPVHSVPTLMCPVDNFGTIVGENTTPYAKDPVLDTGCIAHF